MVHATMYDYTRGESFGFIFPNTDEEIDKIMNTGREIMVDDADCINITSEFGENVREFNKKVKELFDKGIQAEDLKILSHTYLFNEIMDGIDNALIINFDEETKSWSTSDFYNDSDKGRVLFDNEIASFPVKVPEELEPYMDYGMLYRDAEVNMDLREVTVDGNHYIVSLRQ